MFIISFNVLPIFVDQEHIKGMHQTTVKFGPVKKGPSGVGTWQILVRSALPKLRNVARNYTKFWKINIRPDNNLLKMAYLLVLFTEIAKMDTAPRTKIMTMTRVTLHQFPKHT